ncbi:hypothetical protein [Novipirellula aureliae]|uniref:hypothetical protein n=1 Tax=Novipirellula aureliae TaxID=2527966 RepID=UPI0018CD14C4|nr:hypothetical protein [Novipirellula aureliae]
MGLALAVPADTLSIQVVNGDTLVTPSPLPLAAGPLSRMIHGLGNCFANVYAFKRLRSLLEKQSAY